MKKERKNPLDRVRQHAISAVFNDQFECPWSNKIWRKVWLSEFIRTKEYLFHRVKVSGSSPAEVISRSMDLFRADRTHTFKRENSKWTMRISTL